MVIGYLNIVWPVWLPYEANTPLIVYPNAILSFTITFQWFQVVSRWNFQVLDILCGIQNAKLAASRPLNIDRQFSGYLSLPYKVSYRVRAIESSRDTNRCTSVFGLVAPLAANSRLRRCAFSSAWSSPVSTC